MRRPPRKQKEVPKEPACGRFRSMSLPPKTNPQGSSGSQSAQGHRCAMRVRAVLGCGIVLAAMMTAQNPPSTSPPTSPGDSGQQQTQQQPENPLAQPPKPTDQVQKPSPATFELGGAPGAGKDQELGEVRLMTRYTQINGDPTKSFYVPGENNLGEFNYFLD